MLFLITTLQIGNYYQQDLITQVLGQTLQHIKLEIPSITVVIIMLAKIDGTGQEPTGTTNSYWDLVVEGLYWRNNWSSGTDYKIGDAVWLWCFFIQSKNKSHIICFK